MNQAELALRRASTDLDELGKRWALVGGFAVATRVEPRFTRDVDIVVSVASDAEAETTIFELGGRGYDVGPVVEQEATERLATARLIAPTQGEPKIHVDLLFSSSGIEPEIVAEADRIDVLPGLRLPVGQVGHLIAVKLLATAPERPQDDFDLEKLCGVADAIELSRARTAVELITKRGYHRERDLVAALDSLLTAHGD